jgi:hypothetical protein
MTKKASTAAALALILLCVGMAGCGGGHHGGSPTESTQFTVKITTLIMDVTSTPTLLEARLLVDGKLANDANAGAGALPDLGLFAQGTEDSSGTHTISIVIAAQTASPTTYLILPPEIQVFDASGARVQDIHLDQRQVSLATGQSVDYTATF